jgi:uncharacterized ubiquitin-like protein YukD
MFKKPSELWGDDPEMKKADSSKQTYLPFVFPELILGEKLADGKVGSYNVFERFIDIIIKSPEGKAVLKATGFLDLDKIWEKSEHPQVKAWKTHIPKGKTLNLAQMFPNPYSGRKLYYSFLMFMQDFEWESKEIDQKDEKGNKIKKNQKKFLVNEVGDPINRLGGFQPFKAHRKGGSVELYINSWAVEKIKERDAQGNIIETVGKEMVYWKTKGYFSESKVLDYFLILEKAALDQQKIQPDFDKPYLWILTAELKAPAKDAKYPEYSCNIDAFYLSK